jgi:hypothetical protein
MGREQIEWVRGKWKRIEGEKREDETGTYRCKYKGVRTVMVVGGIVVVERWWLCDRRNNEGARTRSA